MGRYIICSATYQRNNHFAIGVGLEVIRLIQRFPQDPMVVDLSVDRQDERSVIVHQRLGSRV
jgi:hypothetical protein